MKLIAKAMIKRLTVISGVALLSLSFLLTAPVVRADTPNCDNNAVMMCGAFDYAELSQKYQQNQGGNVQALYSAFGIGSASALQGLVEGQVTSGNQVILNGHVVATDAVTAGRQNMPGSTPILGGQFYQRPPSVSFASSPLRAFVRMDNNVFQYAIILSCGNPVKATPTTMPPAPQPKPQPQPTPQHPAFTLAKQVSVDQSNWQPQVNVKPGNQVFYQVTIKNTGDEALTNVHFNDVLPGGVAFVANSLTVNAQPQTGSPSGSNLGSLQPGQTITLVYKATVDPGLTGCGNSLPNTVHVKPEQLPEQTATATVNVCVSTPAKVTAKPIPTTPSAPTPTQSTPSTLPNTGAGDILGMFFATVLGGAMAHRLMFFVKRAYLR